MAQPKIKSEQIDIADLTAEAPGGLVAYDANSRIPIQLSKVSTGLFSGGLITEGTAATEISVSAGEGIVVDNYTNPESPTYTLVSWTAFIDVTVTNIATAERTFVAIDPTGPTLLQQPTEFSTAERRDYVLLGAVGHANNVSVVAVLNTPVAAFDSSVRLADLALAIGSFNMSGNVYGDNGVAVSLTKTVGESYRLGNNFHTDPASPDVTTDASEIAPEFNYSYQDGVIGYTLTGKVSLVDSAFYDDGTGTLAAMPSNQWQVQVIYHFPGGGGHRIEYGQTLYGTKALAVADTPNPLHLHNPAFSNGIIRSYLIVKEGATDLSATLQAEFIEASKFGGGAGGTGGGGVFTSSFESAELGIAATTNYSTAHGLGVIPKGTQAFLICKTAELGYSINDEAEFMNNDGTTTYKGVYSDATNIGWYTGANLSVTNRTTGAIANVTLANWKIILRAYA